ncbi:MAG: hypothetical protein IPK60_00865 [Sandaracinaceae bacterium]|nr:hypothetical protein [Sandaracinaceae bacterium]
MHSRYAHLILRVSCALICLLALAGDAGVARAYDVRVESDTVFQAYEVRSPGTSALMTRRRLLQTLGLSFANPLVDEPDSDGRMPTLSANVRLRLEQDFGDTCLLARELCVRATNERDSGVYQPLAQTTLVDLPSAYVDVSGLPLGVLVRAGRQLTWDTIGFARFDGAFARATPFAWLAVEGLAGAVVRSTSLGGTSAFEIAGVPRLDLGNVDPSRVPFIAPPSTMRVDGGALELGRSEWVRGRIAFREMVEGEGVVLRRLGTGLVSEPLAGFRVQLDGVWDLLDGKNIAAAAATSYDLPSVRLLARVERNVPRFDPGTIWAYFAIAPISEGQLNITVKPSERTEIGGAFRARYAELGSYGNDVDWGGEAHGMIRVGSTRLSAAGSVWGGDLGPTSSVLLDISHPLNPFLSFEGRTSLWYFNDPLRTSIYGVSLAEMVGVRWKVGAATSVMVELDHATSRVTGHRFRMMMSVHIGAWR